MLFLYCTPLLCVQWNVSIITKYFAMCKFSFWKNPSTPTRLTNWICCTIHICTILWHQMLFVTYLHILLILNNTHTIENIKIKIICLWQVNESTITNKTKRFGRSSGQTLGAMNQCRKFHTSCWFMPKNKSYLVLQR